MASLEHSSSPAPSKDATAAPADVDPAACVTRDQHLSVLRGILAVPATTAADAPHTALLDTIDRCIDVAGAASGEKPGGQAEYEAAYADFFAALDSLAAALRTQRFLNAADPTHPGLNDIRLFVVLVRFPWLYFFYKLNRLRLDDLANGVLAAFSRDVFQWPGVAKTVDHHAIRRYEATLSDTRNPKVEWEHEGVIPTGGIPDLWRPHSRVQLGGRDHSRMVGTSDAGSAAARAAGAFVRPESRHRNWISAEEGAEFPVEADRYHLYVANNCPWSHRTILGRAMLGLQNVVTMDVLCFRRHAERGWQFRPDVDGCTVDTVNGKEFLVEIYEAEGSTEKSVPVLYDKKKKKIVSNESADILRMFNTALRPLGHNRIDLVPAPLEPLIDSVNVWVYHTLANASYKAGFSSSQEASDAAVDALFASLEAVDAMLAKQPFLCGAAVTEADVRLFPMVFRLDHIYYTRMRLNRKMIGDYQHLSAWRTRMLAIDGVVEASNLDHCKRGYFGRSGNHIVPVGPEYEMK